MTILLKSISLFVFFLSWSSISLWPVHFKSRFFHDRWNAKCNIKYIMISRTSTAKPQHTVTDEHGVWERTKAQLGRVDNGLFLKHAINNVALLWPPSWHPKPTVGVQCADQGITLNWKELLLEEAGSASLTSMISLQLLAIVLGSDMQSLAPAEKNVPLTKDLHWFGMFLTGKQKAFQA